MRRALLFVCLLLVPSSLHAATYYVDYVAGADTNNGTSTATPWKRAPGMVGCANTCASTTLAAGDVVRFKGGVTWPSAALPLTVPTSGSSGNHITFGADVTWFTGTNSGTVNTHGTLVTWASGAAFNANDSWDNGAITINGVSYTISSVLTPYALRLTTSAGTQSAVAYSNSLFTRPIFDGEDLDNYLILISAKSYLNIQNLELKREIQLANATGATVSITTPNGNVVMEYLDVHDWSRCTANLTPTAVCSGAVGDNQISGSGIYVGMGSGNTGTNIALKYSNVGSPEGGGNHGGCTRAVQTLVGNHIHDCSQACLHGCQLVYDNVIQDVGDTWDGTTHTNVLYADCFDGQCDGSPELTTATAYIYNNWIIDSRVGSTVIYPNPGTATVSSGVTFYVFNNVVSCSAFSACDQSQAMNIDMFGAADALDMRVYSWNNTFVVDAAGICTRVTDRSYPLDVLEVKNQHCIAATGGTSVSQGVTSSYTSANLLLQASAAANTDGYAQPEWEPTIAGGDTVDAGVDLTAACSGQLVALCTSTTLGGTRTGVARPNGSAWDIGAFAFEAGEVPPTPDPVIAGRRARRRGGR